jgi:AraC-like DNA-binding protein
VQRAPGHPPRFQERRPSGNGLRPSASAGRREIDRLDFRQQPGKPTRGYQVFTQGRPKTPGLPADYLLSDEFALLIVRFGLRLTAHRWGMSERTLRRFFESLGTNPRRIVRDVRHREAERLLATGQPLPDIARHLGFSSEKTFSRWVHEEFGSTPTTFRRTSRRPA